MKFATKHIQHYPLRLRYVATLPWEIKNSNFLHIFSRYGRECKKRILSAAVLSPLCMQLCMLSVFMFFIKILFSSLNTMMIVDTHCSDVCCEFPVPQIDRKSKQVQSVWRKARYAKRRKYQNLWMNNKVRGDNMQFVCIFFHIC